MKPGIFFLLFCLASISTARAQTVSSIFSNGDPANRIDIVVLSEGYTAAESAKFTSEANTFINSFFREGIFVDYRSYFNVRSVFVASAESGATHLELTPPVSKNTAFGAFYGCNGVDRALCVDANKVHVAINSVLPANQRDYIIVLVNDPTYGGTGGELAVVSTDPQVVDLMLHEFGHTHGLLADEYDYGPPLCNIFEPFQTNATVQTVRNQIKWSHWIDASTLIPTTIPAVAVPGLYQGAVYCASGMYRPTFNSIMRSLGNPFEQVNDEQMVRRFYNIVSTIDSATPTGTSLSAPKGAKPGFSVTPLRPVQHSLSVSWFLDGVLVASGTSFTLDTSALSVALHSVRAEARDNTARVRSDPFNLTSDSQTWAVTVTTAPVSLTSNDAPFGSVNVSDTKVSSPAITLANSGTAVLTIGSITLTGADAAQFSVATTCGTLPVQIAVGRNCTIAPSFKATSTGAKSAAVSISDDAAGSPHSISLSGMGADFAITGSAPATVTAGQAANFTIDLTTTASPTVNASTFTATGNPPGTTVTFNPQSIPAGTAAGSTALTIGTTIQASMPSAPLAAHAPLWPFALTLLGTMGLVSTNRGMVRKRFGKSAPCRATHGMFAMLIFAVALVIGCSGGNGSTGGAPPSAQDTSGTYAITVTATSGSVSRTTQVTLKKN
jgi:hypothetical protein